MGEKATSCVGMLFHDFHFMKRRTIIYSAIFSLLFISLSGSAQTLLLDSLKGKWTMLEQYNNKNRVEPKGGVEFLEDGTFKSNNSYFGTSVGLYRTDETKQTIQIEISGVTTEWTAGIRNHVLRMVKAGRKKAPRVELVLLSENYEFNSGSR